MPLIRNELRRDDATERLTQYSTAEFRAWVAVAFLASVVAGVFATLFLQGITAVLAASLTAVVLVVGLFRLRREHRLLHDHKTAVATVSDWKRTEGPEGGYLYEIKYQFLAEDGQLYSGSSGACSRELPRQGETVPVAYRADNPNDNLTLATFWFYSFSYEATE